MARLAAGFLAFLVVATVAKQKGAEMSMEDADWLRQVRQRAIDALMPLDVPGLRAAYRFDPARPQDGVERYFMITAVSKASFDQYKATLVIPVGNSISNQLLDLRRQDYQASFESILVRVSVRRLTMDAVTCPAIVNRMSVLSKLAVSLQDDHMIRLDHAVHQVTVWFSSGVIDAKLYDENQVLAKWATETQTVLQACSKS